MTKRVLFVIALLGISISIYAQAPVISPTPGNYTVCPGERIIYQLQIGGNFTGCGSYSWTVSNGSFSSTSSVTSKTTTSNDDVDVYWNDVASTGTLTVTSSCAEGTLTKSSTYAIKSLAGRIPANLRTDITNLYCGLNTVNVYVDQMLLLNTGGTTGITQQYANGYEWTLPPGWRYNGTVPTGPVTTPDESIVITPVDGCKGGSISVRAYVSCTSGKKYSSSTSLSLGRSITSSLVVPSGYTGPKCGKKDPITFTASSLTCATNYKWTATNTQWKNYTNDPNGTQGPWNTFTNTITLTPTGTISDQGQIAVEITLDCGTIITQTYAAIYTDPVPPTPFLQKNSLNKEICSGESWTMTCTPQGGIPSNYGFDWYATGGLLINGLTSSSTSPVHTTVNTRTLSANSGSYGNAYIYVRVNNTQCAPSAYASLQTQVGPYSSSQFSISGPSTACPNTTVSYLSTYIDPSITNYQWSWSGFASASGQGTPYLSATTGSSFTNGTITLRLGNRCGLTGSPAIKFVSKPYCSGGFSYALSPNPTDEALTVTVVDEESGVALTEEQLPAESDQTLVAIVNNRSRMVSSGTLTKGKISFDVSSLPNGLYVVKITAEGKVTSKQILIKH